VTAISRLDIAAIVPCFNEEATVAKVVTDLKDAFDSIAVYVYDNNSTDATRERARAAGAIVRTEVLQGKGNVVRRAFADVEADVYILIDGDDTYDVASAPAMVAALLDGPYDHVLGCRVDDPERTAYRNGHAQGNRVFNRIVSLLFGQRVNDMLSGYRVFSRRFVKSFPALSQRFEIETELTIHSLTTRAPQIEMPVGFRSRPDGSLSKLSTIGDGRRIIVAICKLFAMEKPLTFWGVACLLALLAGLVCGVPVITDYLQTGLVQRFPTAFLAASLMVIACLMAMAGVILAGGEFLGAFARTLGRCPGPMMAGYRDQTAQLWRWDNVPVGRTSQSFFLEPISNFPADREEIQRDLARQGVVKDPLIGGTVGARMEQAYRAVLDRTPGTGTWVWALVLVTLAFWYRRRAEVIALVAPALLLWATLMAAAPIALPFRYVAYLPWILAIAFVVLLSTRAGPQDDTDTDTDTDSP